MCGDRALLVMEPQLCHRAVPEVEEEGWSDGVALRVSQEDRPLAQLQSGPGATGQNSPVSGTPPAGTPPCHSQVRKAVCIHI